jgi:hypothetical protein
MDDSRGVATLTDAAKAARHDAAELVTGVR